MKKCLLVVNPQAGQKKISSELCNVINTLNRADYETVVHITSGHNEATHIIEQYKDIDLIICAGGDGTLKQVVSGVISNAWYMPIGYIPCGSTNDYATTLQIPKNIKQATMNIVNGREYQYDVGKINDEYFTYIAAFGLFSSASYNTPQESKNVFGATSYILNGLAEMFDAKEIHAKITIENQSIEDDYIMGLICNTLSIGGVMRLNQLGVDLSDGLFEVLLVKKPKTLSAFNTLIDGLINNRFDDEVVEYYKTNNLQIEFAEPLSFSLDGEKSNEGSFFNIQNMQRRLRFVK